MSRTVSQRNLSAAAVICLLVACSGGGGDGGKGSAPESTFAVSGTITGEVMVGVTVTLSGPTTATVTTGPSGSYIFAGLSGGTYAVRPILSGYTFSPESRTVALNGGDYDGADFSATRLNPTRDIHVTRVVREVQDNGMTQIDTEQDIAALSVEGAPTVTSGGPTTWTVSGVPTGTYVLRVDWKDDRAPIFIRTDSADIDLSTESGGLGKTYPTVATAINMNLSAFSPWLDYDAFQLFSWDGDTYDYVYPSTMVQGGTSFSAVHPWNRAPLLDLTDRLLVAQMRPSLMPGTAEYYWHAVAMASRSGILMTDGGTANFDAAMSIQADNATLSVDWLTTEFESGVQALPDPEHRLYVIGAPGASLEPTHYNSPDFLVIILNPYSYDQLISGLPYLAFVPSYSQYLVTQYKGYTERFAPGASVGWRFGCGTYRLSPMRSQVRPTVGPPRDVRIQGRDMLVQQSGIGLAPTISWAAPQLGAPSRYTVLIYRLDSFAGTETRAKAVASIFTTSTSIALPRGILSSGGTYVALVRAYVGSFDEATPISDGTDFGESTFVSETFSTSTGG